MRSAAALGLGLPVVGEVQARGAARQHLAGRRRLPVPDQQHRGGAGCVGFAADGGAMLGFVVAMAWLQPTVGVRDDATRARSKPTSSVAGLPATRRVA